MNSGDGRLYNMNTPRYRVVLGSHGNASCFVENMETGERVPNVRKITINAEVNQPTTAIVELMVAEVDAEVVPVIAPHQVIDRIISEAEALQNKESPDDELIVSRAELRAMLQQCLFGR